MSASAISMERALGDRQGSELLARLERLAARVVGEAGLELVELALRGSRGSQHLRVDIDRAGARGVGIDECQQVSRALGTAMDEADLIPGRYVLEVSSPGADRPIRTGEDVRRNTGRRIVVTTRNEDGSQLVHRGRLVGGDADEMVVATDEGEVRLAMVDVVKAHQELEF